MRRTPKQSGVYKYLNSLNLFEKGSDEEILNAKKEYWRQYRREHKKTRRKQKREFTVSFHKSEMYNVQLNAKARGLEVSDYLREAVRADIRKAYVIPQSYVVKQIEQVLLSYKRLIEDIREKESKNWLRGNSDFDSLKAVIDKMANQIHLMFREAPPLIRVISQELQMNPHFITDINNLLRSYDNQGNDKKN